MVGLGLCDDEAKLLTRRGNDLVTAHETRFIETERVRREADELGVRFVGGVLISLVICTESRRAEVRFDGSILRGRPPSWL